MKRILFFIFLFINVQLVWGSESASQSLVKKLNLTQAFSANFEQTVFDTQGNTLQHNSGKMQFDKKRALFYWNVLSPEHQTMWYRNNQFIILDYELAQATVKKNLGNKVFLKKDPSLLPVMLLIGDSAEALKNFNVELLDNKYILKLISDNKHDEALLTKVMLTLNASGAVKEIRYQTTLGQMTVIVFTDAKVNQPLNQSLFQQRLPAGIDIVDASQ